MTRRRLNLSADERSRIEREIRKDRAEDYRRAFDEIVQAAVKYHAELGRDDGLHKARLSKLRSELDSELRRAAETMPWQPDDVCKWLDQREMLKDIEKAKRRRDDARGKTI